VMLVLEARAEFLRFLTAGSLVHQSGRLAARS